MRSVAYRRWDPTQSNLQIEVRAELLRELQPESRGLLYGTKLGSEIRILEAERQAATPPVLPAVGIYVARLRGEVFLTEEDLEWFEKTGASVALVVAGSKGGFFVRETDGTIESVRSHEEFLLADGPPPMPQPAAVAKNAVPARRRSWPAAAAVIAITVPAMALTYWRPAPPALGLHVADQGGQLRVSWKAGQRGILELIDGAEHVTVPIGERQSNITYDRRGKQVEIRLIPMQGHREVSQFAGAAPAGTPEDRLRAHIAALRLESKTLRAGAVFNQQRIEGMEKKIARLTQ